MLWQIAACASVGGHLGAVVLGSKSVWSAGYESQREEWKKKSFGHLGLRWKDVSARRAALLYYDAGGIRRNMGLAKKGQDLSVQCDNLVS